MKQKGASETLFFVLKTVHFDGKTGKTTCYFVGENVDNP
jgi:hypothetical protein